MCKNVMFSDLSCFFNLTAATEFYTYGLTLSLHDARPISRRAADRRRHRVAERARRAVAGGWPGPDGRPRRPALATRRLLDPDRHSRSDEHTSEIQSHMRISYAAFCWKKKN